MQPARTNPHRGSPSPARSLNGQPLCIPTTAATLEGFRAWAVSDAFPESGRIAFLDQEIWIDMSPENFDTHGLVRSEISRVLLNLVRKHKLGLYFPDRTLLTNVAAGLSAEPDGAFALWKTLRSGRVALVPLLDRPDQSKELQGTPDWVMEIVSDSSVRKDTRRLPILYHRAGIAEYWLIDARGAEIDFRILLHGPEGYQPAALRAGWQKSRVFGRGFRLQRRRGELDIWEYSLKVKPA